MEDAWGETPMMTHPSFDKVWRGSRGMRAGIKACERAKCVVSALTLIYSSVDALAALTRTSPDALTTRAEFLGWVEKYFIPELGRELGLTSLDLYAARCGVVHTYGPASQLSRTGRAKMLIYKWRDGHRPDDPVLLERAREATVIEIDDLIDGLDRAVQRFEGDIAGDASLRSRVECNIADLLCYEPWHPIAIIVAA